MSQPLARWEQRDNFRREPHQTVVDAVNELGFISPGEGMEFRRTPFGSGLIDPRPQVAIQSGITQYKVTTAGLATCQAKTWDGTTLGGDAVTITNIQGHALNDILYAVPVANVSGMWLEIPSWSPSTAQYQMIQVTDTTGHVGIGPPRYR